MEDLEPMPVLPRRRLSIFKKSGRGWLKAVLFVLIVIILLVWWSQGQPAHFQKEWQAIFLSNGQVYFGKIAKQNRTQVILKDIYYLQITQPLQQAQEGQALEGKGELSLVKLGNELHGPADAMYINRDQVLFIEDLNDDSKVVQAIKNYQAGQKNSK